VGTRAVLDGYVKPLPSPGFDPQTVQPVTSRYTDSDNAVDETAKKFLNIEKW